MKGWSWPDFRTSLAPYPHFDEAFRLVVLRAGLEQPAPRLGFGRSVVSDTEVPNMLVNMV
jgi:hypothetical protein